MADASRVNIPGSLVVVLVLASVSLLVISVNVVRVYLGMVTCFWSTFVLGGNVTFHGIGFSRGIPLSLISVCTSGPLQKWHVRMVIVIACCTIGGSVGRAPWNTCL